MYKTRETVIQELRDLFGVSDFNSGLANGGHESNGKFYIKKTKMPREEVIARLSKYFDGVGIEDGYLYVESITLHFTRFSVVNGAPK